MFIFLISLLQCAAANRSGSFYSITELYYMEGALRTAREAKFLATLFQRTRVQNPKTFV